MDKPEQSSENLARNLISLRRVRRMTQEGLAAAAGLPRSTISNLESGQGNPSLAVLAKVAAALGTPLDELLSAPRVKVRKWKASEIAFKRRGRGVTTRSLVPEPVPDEMIEIMELEPGAALGGTPHLPGTREFFSCLEGRVTIFVAGESYEVRGGEVLGFPGSSPHSYRNRDQAKRAKGVSVVVFAKVGV
ncbi:MAG TPA: helix-turn-helix domain-containing protein [Gammaproteobacteria bacterium]|nr:helix-turn-helix domain-containing protein [Gammaproteobacteria bacterium]